MAGNLIRRYSCISESPSRLQNHWAPLQLGFHKVISRNLIKKLALDDSLRLESNQSASSQNHQLRLLLFVVFKKKLSTFGKSNINKLIEP